MRARKSWFGISLSSAHAVNTRYSDDNAKPHHATTGRTREFFARLGAGSLAHVEPCLDAGAFVAAAAGRESAAARGAGESTRVRGGEGGVRGGCGEGGFT
jgi:hypothetical protein